MTIDDEIRDEKLQYGINQEAAKVPALSSAKTDKYEHLTEEEMWPSDQRDIIEQAKFAHSPLGKAFQKKQKRTRSNKGLIKKEKQKNGGYISTKSDKWFDLC